jgi:hypothetical protein
MNDRTDDDDGIRRATVRANGEPPEPPEPAIEIDEIGFVTPDDEAAIASLDDLIPEAKSVHDDARSEPLGDAPDKYRDFSDPPAPAIPPYKAGPLKGNHWATRLWLDEQAKKKERQRGLRRLKQKLAKAEKRAAERAAKAEKRAANAPGGRAMKKLMDYLDKPGARQAKLRNRVPGDFLGSVIEIMRMWDVRERYRAENDGRDPSLNQYAEAWNAKDIAWSPAPITRYQARNHLKDLANLDREAWSSAV